MLVNVVFGPRHGAWAHLVHHRLLQALRLGEQRQPVRVHGIGDGGVVVELPARAGNHRFGLLSALRAHTKAPYKPDLLWETRRALNCPGRARTVKPAFAPSCTIPAQACGL